MRVFSNSSGTQNASEQKENYVNIFNQNIKLQLSTMKLFHFKNIPVFQAVYWLRKLKQNTTFETVLFYNISMYFLCWKILCKKGGQAIDIREYIAI